MKTIIDDTLELAGVALVIAGTFCLTVLLGLTVFGQKPNGYYIEAAPSGHVSQVYQDIKWGPDRLIFTGPNGQAWQVLYFVENPGLPVPPLPKNKQADL